MSATIQEMLSLDQRIGEHVSVVRLSDVAGMPNELRDVVFVIDRTYTRRGRPRVAISAPFELSLEKAEPFVQGIILAADALRGSVDPYEEVSGA